MRRSYLFFILFFSVSVQAQDLTGIWRGHFRNNNESLERLTGEDDRYKMEVQIAQNSHIFKAVTYSYKSTVFFGKAEAAVSENLQTKKVVLRELKIVEVRMAQLSAACIMTCFLQYTKLGEEEFLEGTFSSMNMQDSSDCGKGMIFLHKVPESDFYKEPFLVQREKEMENEKKKPDLLHAPSLEKKKDTSLVSHKIAKNPLASKKAVTLPVGSGQLDTKKPLAKAAPGTHTGVAHPPAPGSSPRKADLAAKNNTIKPGPRTSMPSTIESVRRDSVGQIGKKVITVIPKVLSSRTNELVRTITVSTPEVQLSIYDDGTIDNDSVSVYFDKKLIVSHVRLTDKAILVNLRLDDGNDTHEVVMVAENEGDIPPNTSLMIVKAGSKEYEVRIVSTEQKNAVILFKYEKPE